MANPQSWNRYSYSYNNPVIYTDPNGHDPVLFVLLVAVAMIATACSPTATLPAPSASVPTRQGTLPVSGYERPEWNGDNISTVNCYAYALDLKQDPRIGMDFQRKLQPGELSGDPIGGIFEWGWEDVVQGMESDLAALNRTVVPGSRDEPCAPGSYKIALTVDPLNDDNGLHDYHFYRQDPDGLWSSKPGGGAITRFDYEPKLIYDPQKADPRNPYQPSYKYTEFNGYYCVSVPR